MGIKSTSASKFWLVFSGSYLWATVCYQISWLQCSRRVENIFLKFRSRLNILDAKRVATKQDPYWGPKNVRRHRKKFSRHGDFEPGIVLPLCSRISYFSEKSSTVTAWRWASSCEAEVVMLAQRRSNTLWGRYPAVIFF
jgi:hypothetical protein